MLADDFTRWLSNYNKQLRLDTILAWNLNGRETIVENIPMARKHCPFRLSYKMGKTGGYPLKLLK